MEEKINLIVDKLCEHKINRKQAKDQLAILIGTESMKDESKEALRIAVSAIYFNDNSDYLGALYSIAKTLFGCDVYNPEKLFNELNK